MGLRRSTANGFGRWLVKKSEQLLGVFGYSRTPANEAGTEGAGFEPAMELPPYTLSRRAPSTARPPLRAALISTGRAPETSEAPAPAQRGPPDALSGLVADCCRPAALSPA